MMTAQDLLIEKANNIVEKFKNSDCTNIEEVLNDYNNDISSFENLPEDFLFKRYKSEGHEKFSQMLIDGYERLDSEIKKQFKREFFKNVEKRCPFCGQLLETSGKTVSDVPTADLDHFFPKSKYPQFALLPQNLIPTCMECNRIEKHVNFISPKEFKVALKKLKLLKDFQSHPNFHFKIFKALNYDCNNEKFKNNDVNVQKLIKMYGLNERYKNIKNKSFSILLNIIRHSDIRSPESLERLLENMASSNWHEVNDGYSLNNNPQIWQEFIENILYDECKLLALWDEVKSYNLYL